MEKQIHGTADRYFSNMSPISGHHQTRKNPNRICYQLQKFRTFLELFLHPPNLSYSSTFEYYCIPSFQTRIQQPDTKQQAAQGNKTGTLKPRNCTLPKPKQQSKTEKKKQNKTKLRLQAVVILPQGKIGRIK